MRIKSLWWVLFFWLCSAVAFAAHEKPLPAEQAFVFSTHKVGANKLVLQWKIAPNYYLYAKRFQIDMTPAVKAVVRYPKAHLKKKQLGGLEAVYFNQLSIPVIFSDTMRAVALSVTYQGCSEHGFCYPPVHKEVTFNADAGQGLAFSISSLFASQQGVLLALQTQHYPIILLFFLMIGLLFAFTPCVLPMIPILTAIIVGQHSAGTKKSFFLALTYVLGMAVAYAMAGVAAALMGSSIQVWLQKPWVIILMSALIVLLAISLFEWYELRFSKRWHNYIDGWSRRHKGGTHFGVFCMGVLSTLVVSPCITAPLMGVLIYISQTGNAVLGGGALFALGLGMGIPLILLGMSANKWLPKSGTWMNAVRKLMGFCMLAFAVWMLSRILLPVTIMLLWSAWLFSLAVFFYVSMPRLTRLKRINRGIGILAAILGVFVILSGANTLPLNKVKEKPETIFTVITDLNVLKQQLATAAEAHQPVLLDFYADWCEACVVMDKQVFSQEAVKAILKGYRLLRVDLTKNDAAEVAILKAYQVIAPPTILFFARDGTELNTERLVGGQDQKEFISHLTVLKKCQETMVC